MKTKFELGQKVLYKGCWGMFDETRTVITGIGIHNGRRVYDVEGNKWGYERQITAI